MALAPRQLGLVDYASTFAAMQAFEYADLEYKPLTRLNIVDKA